MTLSRRTLLQGLGAMMVAAAVALPVRFGEWESMTLTEQQVRTCLTFDQERKKVLGEWMAKRLEHQLFFGEGPPA